MLFSGIDLHKRSLVIHMLDAEGTTTREAELRSAISWRLPVLTSASRTPSG